MADGGSDVALLECLVDLAATVKLVHVGQCRQSARIQARCAYHRCIAREGNGEVVTNLSAAQIT
jgi:hypothetical protein